MNNKTSDEKWVEQFIARHPATRSRMRVRDAAQAILHDSEVLAPDRVKRLKRKIAVETLTTLIDALREGDSRTAMKILKPLGYDAAMKLLDAIRRAEGGKEGGR